MKMGREERPVGKRPVRLNRVGAEEPGSLASNPRHRFTSSTALSSANENCLLYD